MNRTPLILIALAACHHGASAPNQDTLGNDTVPRQDEVFVDARTLLVDGPTPTTPRVQLARFGVGQIALGGESIDGQEDAEWFDTLAVSETRGDKVRVRYDELGDASLLVWIASSDLRIAVVREAAVAAGPGAAFAEAGQPGVWLEPGAVPDTLAPAKDGARRTFKIDVDDLIVSGEIEASVLGTMWVPPPPEPDHEDWVYLDNFAHVLVAPADGAAQLAETTTTTPMLLVSSKDGWSEVRSTGPHVIVHGYVQDAAIVLAGGFVGHDRGTHMHAARKDAIEVPTGSCLYDGKNGELVGVATSTFRRDAQDLGGGWHEVLAGSAWGAFSVAVHEVDGKLEACATEQQLSGR